MTRTRFNDLVQNPSAISYGEIDELKNVIEQFPYFQSARMLFAKGLYDTKSYLYNDELKKTAAFAGDRKVLHKLIHSVPSKLVEEFAEEKNYSEPVATFVEEETPTTNETIFEDVSDEKEFSEKYSDEIIFESAEEKETNEEDFPEEIVDIKINQETQNTEPQTLNPEPFLTPEPSPRVLSAAEILSMRLREIEKDLGGEKTETEKPAAIIPIQSEPVVHDYFEVSSEIKLEEFIPEQNIEPEKVSEPEKMIDRKSVV